ncbi:hypothetical protein NCC49_005387 [Naganishia albida]|nr:hypothetical protein NCC49_005387 [Naganishia albida]
MSQEPTHDTSIPSEEDLRAAEKAYQLLGPPPSLASSGYLRQSNIEHVKAILGSSVGYERWVAKVLNPRLSKLMTTLATPSEVLSTRSTTLGYTRAQKMVEGLRKAVAHFTADEDLGQVFSVLLEDEGGDDRFADYWLLEYEGRNSQKTPPFLIIDRTGEILQTTVRPECEKPIAIQIAVRWQVPSRRGPPDSSWQKVCWQELVTAAEMRFTVETAQFLISEADEAASPARVRYASSNRDLCSSPSQFMHLPTIMETEHAADSDSPTIVDEPLALDNLGLPERGYQAQSEITWRAAVEGLMLDVVKDNITRLRTWITGDSAQIIGTPRPRMVDKAFSLMNSLTQVDGLKAVLDPEDLKHSVFLAEPIVVEGDFDHVFKHVLSKTSIPGGKPWQFVSSESELRAKRRRDGKTKNKIILVYKLNVMVEIDSVARPLEVEGSGVFVIKQMERFVSRQDPQAGDKASSSLKEFSSTDTYSALDSRYLQDSTARMADLTINSTEPTQSAASAPGESFV